MPMCSIAQNALRPHATMSRRKAFRELAKTGLDRRQQPRQDVRHADIWERTRQFEMQIVVRLTFVSVQKVTADVGASRHTLYVQLEGESPEVSGSRRAT